MLKLKYLFEATFNTGVVYKQNRADTSIYTPHTVNDKGEPQGKSCTSDIQEGIDKLAIDKFVLIEQGLLADNKWSVDLKDGHFEHNGVQFGVQDDHPLPTLPPKFKLIYFRTRYESHTSPALFNNPLKVDHVGGKKWIITNRAGQKVTFENVDKMWTEDSFGWLDGIKQKISKVYVLPYVAAYPTLYCLGWQCTVAGKNYQQVVTIH